MAPRSKGHQTNSNPIEIDLGPYVPDPNEVDLAARGLVDRNRRESDRRVKTARLLRRAGLVGMIILALVVTLVMLNVGSKYADTAKKAEEATSPAMKVRYGEYGAQVIEDWFVGNAPTPGIRLATGVTWPGSSVDPVTGMVTFKQDSSKVGKTTINGVRQIDGYRKVANLDPKAYKSNPEINNPVDEVNIYTATLNQQQVWIAIYFLIPDPENDSSLPVLRNQPGVFESRPTVSLGGENSLAFAFDDRPEGYNLDPKKLPDSAQPIIVRWASAWAENRMTDIKISTGDSSTERHYRGLGGWQTDEGPITVLWSYSIPFEGQGDRDFVVARIQFNMVQDAAVEAYQSQQKAQGAIPSNLYQVQTMDVLIADSDSGSPTVVSWGPAGSFHDISPYSTGFVDSKFNAGTEKPGATTTQKPQSNGSSATTTTPSSSGGSSDSGSTPTTTPNAPASTMSPDDTSLFPS